jgi:hypothetical protein
MPNRAIGAALATECASLRVFFIEKTSDRPMKWAIMTAYI